jgi:hypothetical protein
MGTEHKEEKYEGTSKIDAAIGNATTNGAKALAIGGIVTAGLGVANNISHNPSLGSAAFYAGVATLALTGLSVIKGGVDGATHAGETKERYEELVEKNQKLGQENKVLKSAVTNTITSALAQGTLVTPERAVGA